MEDMVAAYFRFCAEQETPLRPRDEPGQPADRELYNIQVVDLFGAYSLMTRGRFFLIWVLQDTTQTSVELAPGMNGIASALIHKGLMPCAPWTPSVAIKIRVLELYRVQHVRCPHLAIQPFVKSLCDLHGVRVLSSLSFFLSCRSNARAGALQALLVPAIFNLLRFVPRHTPTHRRARYEGARA